MKTVEVPEASPKLASLLAQAGDEDLVVKPPDGREFLLLAIDEFDIEITRTRANTRIMELLDARAGSTAALPLAPVISAPASPDSKDSLSRGRVRKPDTSDPVVVSGPGGHDRRNAGARPDQAVADGSGLNEEIGCGLAASETRTPDTIGHHQLRPIKCEDTSRNDAFRLRSNGGKRCE